MSPLRSILVTLILSALAASIGAWGGAAYVQSHARRPLPLHEMLHQRLHLSAQQTASIEGLEQQHAAKRQALEAEMRAANRELAQAYQASHAYTPQVQAAIDRFHHAMDALQTETMRHVIAMRSVLTPAQTAAFDASVVKSLTDQTP